MNFLCYFQGNRLDKLLLTHWQKFTFNPRYNHTKFGISVHFLVFDVVTPLGIDYCKGKKIMVLCEINLGFCFVV